MERHTKKYLAIAAAWVTWFVGSLAIAIGWGAAFYPSPVGQPRIAPYQFWSIGFAFLIATLLFMWRAQRLSNGSGAALFMFG